MIHKLSYGYNNKGVFPYRLCDGQLIANFSYNSYKDFPKGRIYSFNFERVTCGYCINKKVKPNKMLNEE